MTKTVDLNEFKSQKEQRQQEKSEYIVKQLVDVIEETVPITEEIGSLPLLIGILRGSQRLMIPSPVQPRCKDDIEEIIELIEGLDDESPFDLDGILVVYAASAVTVKKDEDEHPDIRECIMAQVKLKDGTEGAMCQYFERTSNKIILTERIDLNDGKKVSSRGLLDTIFNKKGRD